MKFFSVPLLAVFLLLASGCQLKWVRLDGDSVDQARLEEAKQSCRVERKLAALERAREERDDKLARSSTNEAKMLLKDDFDAVEKQVYLEIDTCMHKQGYMR